MNVFKAVGFIIAAFAVVSLMMAFKTADAHEGASTWAMNDGAGCHNHQGNPKFHCHIPASDSTQQGKEEWGFQTETDDFEGTSYSFISIYDTTRSARLIVGCNANKGSWLRIGVDEYLGLAGLNDDDLNVRIKTTNSSSPYTSDGWVFSRSSGFIGSSIVKDKHLRFMIGDDLTHWYQGNFLSIRMRGYSKTIDRHFSLNGFRDALHKLWDECGVPLTN